MHRVRARGGRRAAPARLGLKWCCDVGVSALERVHRHRGHAQQWGERERGSGGGCGAHGCDASDDGDGDDGEVGERSVVGASGQRRVRELVHRWNAGAC